MLSRLFIRPLPMVRMVVAMSSVRNDLMTLIILKPSPPARLVYKKLQSRLTFVFIGSDAVTEPIQSGKAPSHIRIHPRNKDKPHETKKLVFWDNSIQVGQ